MNTLHLPLPEINGHPDNQRLHWEAGVPSFANPGDINLSLTGVDAIADAAGINQVFVVPADDLGIWALAKRGFTSGISIPGSEIAARAAETTNWAVRIRDGDRTHAAVKLDPAHILENLCEVDAEDRPDRWALYLDRQLGTALGLVALRNVATRPDRLFELSGALWRHRKLITANNLVR